MDKVKIVPVVTDILQENCYIVYKNGKGFLIDPSGDAAALDERISETKAEIKAVLLTHGHFDHCLLAKYYRDKGIPVYIHKDDADKLQNKGNLALMVGVLFPYTAADVTLDDKCEKLNIADIEVKVIHTPGHSKGSVCYVVEEASAIFTGDLIMKLSYGRTDFYDGDFDELVGSFKTIFALAKDYTLYPGHGDTTTLAYEKRNNMIKLDAEGEF